MKPLRSAPGLRPARKSRASLARPLRRRQPSKPAASPWIHHAPLRQDPTCARSTLRADCRSTPWQCDTSGCRYEQKTQKIREEARPAGPYAENTSAFNRMNLPIGSLRETGEQPTRLPHPCSSETTRLGPLRKTSWGQVQYSAGRRTATQELIADAPQFGGLWLRFRFQGKERFLPYLVRESAAATEYGINCRNSRLTLAFCKDCRRRASSCRHRRQTWRAMPCVRPAALPEGRRRARPHCPRTRGSHRPKRRSPTSTRSHEPGPAHPATA